MKKMFNIKLLLVAAVFLFFIKLFFSPSESFASSYACFMNNDSQCENIDGSPFACKDKCQAEGKTDCDVDFDSLCPQSKTLGCTQLSAKCATGQGCESADYNGCKNITYYRDGAAVLARCKASCPAGYLCELLDKPCAALTQRSCYKDGKCTNITATDFSDADSQCKKICGNSVCATGATACAKKRNYGCFLKNGDCFNNSADSLLDAQIQCKEDCDGKDGCTTSVEPCQSQSIEDPNNPLSGTSINGLKASASQILNPGNLTTPQKFISRAINLMTAFIGSIALGLYVMAGLLWMTASGNEERVGKAKQILVWTTLGVVVMLASYMLVTMVFGFIPK